MEQKGGTVSPVVIIIAIVALVGFLIFMGTRYLKPAPYTPSPGAGSNPTYPGGGPGAGGNAYPGGGASPRPGGGGSGPGQAGYPGGPGYPPGPR